MARRSKSEPTHARLTAQQMREAIPKIQRRIEELKRLDPSAVQNHGDAVFEAAETKTNYTLREIFGPDTVEYSEYSVSLDTASIYMGGTPLPEIVEGYRRGVERAVTQLDALVSYFKEESNERVGLDEIPAEEKRQVRKVFVVHGHDEAAKQEVARFLDKLGLEPVVLHEQVNEGQTVIEKFEKHAGQVGFAVVLLTPDDVGYPTGKPEALRSRARQNVVLELGFFVGALGRRHVVALLRGDVEIPSDLHGVLYEPMDAGGGWTLRVAREIKSAGIDVDLNRAM